MRYFLLFFSILIFAQEPETLSKNQVEVTPIQEENKQTTQTKKVCETLPEYSQVLDCRLAELKQTAQEEIKSITENLQKDCQQKDSRRTNYYSCFLNEIQE